MMDWSSLNSDVLRTIAEEKLDLEDYVRCQSVCRNWKSVIRTSPMSLRRPQLPWLLLPECHHHTTTSTSPTSCRCFYSISEGKTHHMEFLPGYDDKRFVGSSHGWLIVVEETSPFIFLLNPFTKRTIQLPPISSFPDILNFDNLQLGREYLVAYDEQELHLSMNRMSLGIYLDKVILSSDPTLPGCIAVAIFGDRSRLAYCRVGLDQKWAQVHHDFRLQEDVIFWKGAFYAAGHTGSLLIFDPNIDFNSPPKVDVIVECDHERKIYGKSYLVADSFLDQLLLIHRELVYWDDNDNYNRYKTSKIDVYSLNEEKKLWEKRQSLGGKVLFLGSNYTLSFSADDYPQLKPNTFYFTDDYLEGYKKGKAGGHDVGSFDMDDGVIKPLPCCDPQSTIIWPPPIWVTPSLTAS